MFLCEFIQEDRNALHWNLLLLCQPTGNIIQGVNKPQGKAEDLKRNHKKYVNEWVFISNVLALFCVVLVPLCFIQTITIWYTCGTENVSRSYYVLPLRLDLK